MISQQRPAAEPAPDRSSSPWALVIVGLGVLAGLGYAVLAGKDAWRVGCVIIGAALGAGALLRLVLPQRAAGLLAVRGRAFDVFFLVLGGAAIIVLALLVPGGR